MRHLGIDLHSNNFVVCYRSESGQQSLAKYRLSQIEQFRASLEKADQVAVEACATSRWFVNRIKHEVQRIVVVNPRQFEVIAKSVKKTDAHDAQALAEFLSVDLLPEVRHKSEAAAEAQSLCSLRTSLVQMSSQLFNRMQAVIIASGNQEAKRSVKSALGRRRLLGEQWSEIERLELEILSSQIESLDKNIEQLEEAIEKAAEKLSGYWSLLTIKGIGSQSAALLSAVIGNFSEFASANKLAAYFGVVPSLKSSNQTERVTDALPNK
jgi:transposase